MARTGGPLPAEDPRHRHRRRPLDVVVEAGEHLAVPVEQPESVRLLGVLPLQEGSGEAVLHGVDELVHERVVFLAAQARMAPAQVLRQARNGGSEPGKLRLERRLLIPRWR